MDPKSSLVHGPTQNPLWTITLGDLIDVQASGFADRQAVIFPWQSTRLSYGDLGTRSKLLAKSMLDMGLRHGDCVGIMAGNCCQYIEAFLGAARIGCPVVVLNNTYTPKELKSAVSQSCKPFLCMLDGVYWLTAQKRASWSLSRPTLASAVSCPIFDSFAAANP